MLVGIANREDPDQTASSDKPVLGTREVSPEHLLETKQNNF